MGSKDNPIGPITRALKAARSRTPGRNTRRAADFWPVSEPVLCFGYRRPPQTTKIDLPATALSATEPPGSIEQGQPCPVALYLLGNIGFDLLAAVLAPND